MKKVLVTLGFVLGLGLTVSSGVLRSQAVAQTTVHFGLMIQNLASLVMPLQTTDSVGVQRTGSADGFKVPATTWLQTANNLSDVPSETTARNNLGVRRSASITDYPGADPSGTTSSDTAFTSCITSGLDCHIPQGFFVISCTTHNALLANRLAPTTIWGDGYNVSFLRIASGCALPAAGLINLANMRDIAIDANSATASAPTTIVSSSTTSQAIHAPDFDHVYIYNVGNSTVGAANITGFNLSALSGNSVDQIRVVNSEFQAVASSTTPNQCIKVSQSGGTIVGGSIDGNICIDSGIDVSANRVAITNNDIAGWAYRAAIYTEQAANSTAYTIAYNRIATGSNIVTGGVPTDGIANFGPSSLITNNQCQNIGGVCVANTGIGSTISHNHSIGAGKRNDGGGGSSYFSGFVSATVNGNNSNWSDNYGADDGSGLTTNGLTAALVGTDGLSLTNNYFPLLIPYTFF